MYAKIALLLLVAASAAACAKTEQLACREFPTEYGVKGPGCAIDIAQGEAPQPNHEPHDTPDDEPDDEPNEPDPIPQ